MFKKHRVFVCRFLKNNMGLFYRFFRKNNCSAPAPSAEAHASGLCLCSVAGGQGGLLDQRRPRHISEGGFGVLFFSDPFPSRNDPESEISPGFWLRV